MANGLIKFANRDYESDRGKLYWGRASHDGLPFRGHAPPTLTSDEFDQRVVRVADPKNGTFNTGDAEQNRQYMSVLDGVANGWFQLIHIDRWRPEGENSIYVYAEWLEVCLEDGSPAPARHAGGIINHGQNDLTSTLG